MTHRKSRLSSRKAWHSRRRRKVQTPPGQQSQRKPFGPRHPPHNPVAGLHKFGVRCRTKSAHSATAPSTQATPAASLAPPRSSSFPRNHHPRRQPQSELPQSERPPPPSQPCRKLPRCRSRNRPSTLNQGRCPHRQSRLPSLTPLLHHWTRAGATSQHTSAAMTPT
jgi:hypothetical protein